MYAYMCTYIYSYVHVLVYIHKHILYWSGLAAGMVIVPMNNRQPQIIARWCSREDPRSSSTVIGRDALKRVPQAGRYSLEDI